MAHGYASTIDLSSERRRLDELGPFVVRLGWMVGLAALAAGLVLGLIFSGFKFGEFLQSALRSYLVAFCFVLSIGLGALFFVLIQHLTRAGWSVGVRRVAECIACGLPPLALLALPILLGMGLLYPWANPQAFIGSAFRDAADVHLLHLKEAYLNPVFFVIRVVVYFAVWSGLAVYFFNRSVKQDETGDPALTSQMQTVSAPGMLLYAVTVTFASFDLLMSLNPLWFSTIFGVYFFAGSVVAALATIILVMHLLQRAGRLTRVVNTEHYHDLGKLLFGFMVFWTYIAFSQFMLIWYANLPEETVWYRARMNGGWAVFSLVLLFGHFVVPFLALISRHPKRMGWPLVAGAVWMLAVHWLDIYYLVMPVLYGPQFGIVPLGLMDLTMLVALCGLFASAVAMRMSRVSLLPERDPRLAESLAFENY